MFAEILKPLEVTTRTVKRRIKEKVWNNGWKISQSAFSSLHGEQP